MKRGKKHSPSDNEQLEQAAPASSNSPKDLHNERQARVFDEEAERFLEPLPEEVSLPFVFILLL